MKSKKLFAILTLVAFMMTLVPMAAFAAAGVAYSTEKSSFAVADSSVDAFINMTTPEEKSAKFTITFKDASNALVTGQLVDFSLKSNKDVAMGEFDSNADGAADTAINANDMTTSDGDVIQATTDANGKVVFWLGAQVSTSFEVSAYYWNAGNGSIGNKIGSTKTITVKKSATSEIDLALYLDEDDTTAVSNPSAAGVLIAGEGFELRADYGEEDKEVTFKQRYNSGSWTTIGTDETNDDGIATLWVDTDAAGTYEFKAVSGSDNSDVLTAKVFSNEPSVLEAKSVAGTAPKGKSTLVDVWVKDDAGNLVKDSAALYGTGTAANIVKYEYITVPDGSDLEDQEVYASTEVRGFARLNFVPDEIGKYVIKATLESNNATTDDLLGSDSLTFEYNVVEVGTITKLTALLVDDTYKNVIPAVRYLEDVNNDDEPTVGAALLPFLYNSAGASFFTVVGFDGLEFSSSNPAVLSVDDTGKLTVEDDDFTGTVTITMSYEDDAVVATTDVKVVAAPNALTATPTVNGKDVDVKVQLVDAAGNVTTSTSGRDISKDAITVIAPAGVTVSGVSGISSNGSGSFKLSAAPGKYSVTVLTTVDKTAALPDVETTFGKVTGAAQKSLAKTFEVEVKAAATDKPVAGAKTVTMFIGAPGYTQDGVAKVSDVAPFIKDGRTFVAIRPVADAFGAVIGWNEATQTVTLTRADVTVTIKIGSNAITVVKGGVTSTVTADVAAFIKDGRTVLPFRAAGEAFGATVNYDAATQAVTYAQ